MQADMMSMYQRTVEQEEELEKHTRRTRRTRRQRTHTRAAKPVKLSMSKQTSQAFSYLIPQQTIQPIPVQQSQDDSLLRLLEFGWGHLDSDSLKAFQIGDRLSKSEYPLLRTGGSLLALWAMWQGLKKLDEKLSN